jgi:hypothetical protein
MAVPLRPFDVPNHGAGPKAWKEAREAAAKRSTAGADGRPGGSGAGPRSERKATGGANRTD